VKTWLFVRYIFHVICICLLFIGINFFDSQCFRYTQLVTAIFMLIYRILKDYVCGLMMLSL